MSKREHGPRFYLTREPVIVMALSALAVVFFLAVTGLSHLFHAQQDSLGKRWFGRGVKDFQASRYQPAVSSFRTSLLYSRDNYEYQLNLAEALLGEGRRDEASAYLVNLWDREPENGLVNLELARIAAQKAEREQALRYFHNAIYATWTANPPGSQEAARRKVRLELVKYLLSMGDRTQAESELIALAANLDEDDPAQHMGAGELFLEVGDYERAMAEYDASLKLETGNPAALAGAGRAAFQLGRYAPAGRYFQAALAADPSDAQLAEQLKETELVVQTDPFRRQIPFARKSGIVMEAFAAAGERLKSCSAAGNSNGAVSQAATGQSLAGDWMKMKPQITERGLRRNPELVEAAMDLVFEIERQSNSGCGAPSGMDKALLRIAKLHQEK